MKLKNINDDNPKKIPTGSKHHRAYIGPIKKYDIISAMQFNLLTFLGLREYHSLLDIGCGSLRGGKLFISYLAQGHYYGIEPEQWLIEAGIENECGRDLINIKKPTFSNDNDFTCTKFNKKFDYTLAQSIFSHASRNQIRRCLSEVKDCMMPTSIFAATFYSGTENYHGNKWVYPDNVTYTLDFMENLAEEVNLICKPFDWPHPNGQTWILLVDKKMWEKIPDLVAITKPLQLKNNLKLCKDRLSMIESHPYVKFGLKINKIMQIIKRH